MERDLVTAYANPFSRFISRLDWRAVVRLNSLV